MKSTAGTIGAGGALGGHGALGVIGNALVQDRLYRYLKHQRLHPALIFSGAKSGAKLAIAKNGAKMLFCLRSTSNLPFCGSCSVCDRIERDTHPDVWVWSEPEPKDDVIKIEAVREICDRMVLSPVEGDCRICIVDDCHRMTVAAANAFLKTLEEPGRQHYFWLLTSQLGSLLPTLRSRCLEFPFQPEAGHSGTVGSPGPGHQPDRREEFTALFQEFLQLRNPYRVTQRLKEKTDVAAFVHFQQERIRLAVLTDPQWDVIYEFDSWLELEGRLRSNANFGLLLESTLAAK